MFRNFDVNNDSFFSYFSFLRTLMYQFFAAIVRVAALRRESQYVPTHFCWKNTYVFIYFFSWFFLKCLDGPLEPEIPGFRPWGARGAHFWSSGADNWSQKRILGYIISSFMMELYVWGCVYAYTHMHICIYVYAYMQICIYAYIHIYVYPPPCPALEGVWKQCHRRPCTRNRHSVTLFESILFRVYSIPATGAPDFENSKKPMSFSLFLKKI